MSAGAVEDAFSALTPETARTFGARLYLETGLRGIRGEVAGGFPSVLLTGLPTLRALLERGVSMERAGVSVLLALMAGRWIPTSSPGAGRRASAGPRLRRLGCWPRAFSPRRRRWRPWTGR